MSATLMEMQAMHQLFFFIFVFYTYFHFPLVPQTCLLNVMSNWCDLHFSSVCTFLVSAARLCSMHFYFPFLQHCNDRQYYVSNLCKCECIDKNQVNNRQVLFQLKTLKSFLSFVHRKFYANPGLSISFGILIGASANASMKLNVPLGSDLIRKNASVF